MIDPRVKRFVELDGEIDRADAALKALKEERAQLVDQLLDGFADAGMTNVTIGNHTVYTTRQTWAGVDPEKKEEAKEALRAYGLDAFVKEQVNSQQLSAWVRERREADEGIPPAIADVIRITEKWDVRVRRA